MRSAPRRLSRFSFTRGLGYSLVAALALSSVASRAQAPPPESLLVSRNVNMVAGAEWPTGDPYLQRQNEPSVAASTRNPQHLLAGANDYRTVDLPGLADGGETGDAWLGLFKSFDGGERWQSSLLPGYPQDASPEGMASPIKGFQAGADPVVRAGTNGLLYFAGLAFNRGENAPSAIFVSRFIDNNNKENGDPISYLATSVIDKSTGAEFLDKPWLAVDAPRAGSKVCKIALTQAAPVVMPQKTAKGKKAAAAKAAKLPKAGKAIVQNVLAGTMYISYARIKTILNGPGEEDDQAESRIMFSKSDDCGASWSKPAQISRPEDKANQGATIAIDPRSGAVYVAYRQFSMSTTAPDAMMVSRSATAGTKFDAPKKVHQFKAGRKPQQLVKKLKRAHRLGEAEDISQVSPFDQNTAEDRFRTNAYPTIAIDDDGRVYLAWTERGYGANRADPLEGDARVIVSTSLNGGAWTTPRAVDTGTSATDAPGHQMMPSMTFAGGKLVIVYYDLREDVSQVFGPYVDENDAIYSNVRRRHTIDIRAVHALKGDVPVFSPSTRVSRYLMGSRPGSTTIEQMQFNAPNLPLFQLGSVPFLGDYIDIAPSPAFVQDTAGRWSFNTAATTAPVFHVVWTDNRDVRPPADGNWANYTPPGTQSGASKFDPSTNAPSCIAGQTGMRNQNIYSARLTMGLVAGSPGNSKPLSPTVPRSFVVFAQNTSTAPKSFRLTIAAQPAGGVASFDQIGVSPAPPLLTWVDVKIPAKSMVTRTVFVMSSDAKAQVPVTVDEISAPGAQTILPGGLASRVLLNPDISNPDISNPDISNPDISNPDISNVRVANPDISNPDISNPDISNPDISNPDISNPDISNPDISNGALTDVTWTVTNTGNTTASFNVSLFLANAAAKVGGVKTQLVVHKTYTTPVTQGCELKTQTQTVLVANVPNPTFKEPGDSSPFDPSDSDVSNTTLWLEPGGEGKITLRIIDPNPADAVEINPVEDVAPVVQSEPVNTEDLGTPNPEPPATAPPTPAEAEIALTWIAQPVPTILTLPLPVLQVSAFAGPNPAPGVQVTLAIAVNPSAGHLSGTVTVLTDASGLATFPGLSIDKAGGTYRLSASAMASGAVPVLTAPFGIIRATAVATATGGAAVYDAQPHGGTCTVVGMFAEPLTGTISYSSGGAPVNADVHTITCSYAGSDFYDPTSDDATITITPAASVAIVTCPASAVYTGAAQTPCTASVTGAGGLNQAVTPVTYANNTNVGTASANATYAGDANHSGSTDGETFEITPASSVTVVNCPASVVYVYTGAAQTPCTAYVTGAGGLNQAVTPVTYANNTNVGTASANATYAGDANHAGSTDGETFAITPASSATVVTCPSSVVYTGTPQTPCTANVTGAGGLNQAVTPVTYANNTDVGTASANATYAGDANHSSSADSETFTIIAPANPYIVTTTADGGFGSLRNAITAANAAGDANTITFNITGGGPRTISLTSPLPAIIHPATIDATGQPGYDGRPMVRVDAGGTGSYAFHLQAQSTIRGLAITRFTSEPSVFAGPGAGGSVIEMNHIGTDRDGTAGLGNQIGVRLHSVTAVSVRQNLISGNTIDGVLVSGGSVSNIRENNIGTGLYGMGALPNGDNGITLYDGANGTIIEWNVISGNGTFTDPDPGWGIDIQQSGALADVFATVIKNNIIGLDNNGAIMARGAVDYIGPGTGGANFGPVRRGNAGGGIRVNRGAATVIGTAGEGNTISGNTKEGVLITGAMSSIPSLTSNRIGTNLNGTQARGNGSRGVQVNGSTALVGTAASGNIISGNIRDGVFADGNTTIQNNHIGTDGSGTVAIGNGMLQDGGTPTSPGCCHAGVFVVAPANIVRGNLVSGNAGHSQYPGIRSGGAAGAIGNLIENNNVGTNISLAGALPNGVGIGLFGDKSGTVVRANTIGFNTTAGVFLVEGTEGALIGGNAPGDGNALRNNGGGVIVGYNAGATGDVNNRILSNVVIDTGLGIDHGWDGQTANDGPSGNYDTDTGPNRLQNAPLIQLAENQSTTIVDFIPQAAAGTYTFQFFSGSSCTRAESVVTTAILAVSGVLEHKVVDLGVLLPINTRVFMTATDSSGNTSEFKSCVAVTAPAPAFTAWSASGNGTVAAPDNGVADGTPQMTYQHNGDQSGPLPPGPYSGAWAFSTVATETRAVHLDWSWGGFHSYYQVTARLDVFVRRGGVDQSVVTLINLGPQNCCYSPSGGFGYSGATTVTVQAGDTYGFRLYGTHYDGTEVLQGTFNVIVDGVEAPLEISDSALAAADASVAAEDHVEAEPGLVDRAYRPSPERARRRRASTSRP